jgi:ribulose-phosphate 3-epimerase
MKISVSILKSKIPRSKCIEAVEKTDADFIHLDVMDGKFVNNKTFTIDEVMEQFKDCKKDLDIHLMVNHPKEYIDSFSKLKACKYIIIHQEINHDINELIEYIHMKGKKAGIAINPYTKVEQVKPYLENVDYVLIMGVIPGFGGQHLISSTIMKIDELIKVRDDLDYHFEISFDGGVNGDTIKLLDGLDIAVSGSYICMSDDYQKQINTLR